MTIESRSSPGRTVRLLCILPSIPLGGMERAAIRVTQQLIERGAVVHFVADSKWGAAVQKEIDAIGATWTGVNPVASLGRPRTLGDSWWIAKSLLTTSREFHGIYNSFRPNAILATSINAAFFARRLAKRSDAVSVFRIPNPPVLAGNGLQARYHRAIWQAVYSCFDCLVCNSAYTAQRVVDVTGDGAKVQVVRNFPPELNRGASEAAPRLPPGRIHVVFLGQVSEAKGAGIFVEAAKLIASRRNDVDFILAGSGVWRDPFPAMLANRIEKAGVGERIRMIGAVEDVSGLLRQAHLHVCPSISSGDSFPNVILDAKQAGLPSIVFPTAGLPEALTNGVDGVVTESCTAAGLAEAVSDLLDNPERRQRMAEAALASLERFDPERLTTTWLELFRQGL